MPPHAPPGSPGEGPQLLTKVYPCRGGPWRKHSNPRAHQVTKRLKQTWISFLCLWCLGVKTKLLRPQHKNCASGFRVLRNDAEPAIDRAKRFKVRKALVWDALDPLLKLFSLRKSVISGTSGSPWSSCERRWVRNSVAGRESAASKTCSSVHTGYLKVTRFTEFIRFEPGRCNPSDGNCKSQRDGLQQVFW